MPPVSWELAEAGKSSPVAFSHDEINRPEDGYHIAHHRAGQQVREHTQVHKRRSANFQAMRCPAAAAVDVKSEFPLGILSAKINFAWWRIDALSHENEVMD